MITIIKQLPNYQLTMISCKLFISVKIPLDFGNINCTIFNLLFSYPNTKKDCTVWYYNNESSVQSLICELFTLLQHFTNKLHLDVLCKIKVQRVWFLMKGCCQILLSLMFTPASVLCLQMSSCFCFLLLLLLLMDLMLLLLLSFILEADHIQ